MIAICLIAIVDNGLAGDDGDGTTIFDIERECADYVVEAHAVDEA